MPLPDPNRFKQQAQQQPDLTAEPGVNPFGPDEQGAGQPTTLGMRISAGLRKIRAKGMPARQNKAEDEEEGMESGS